MTKEKIKLALLAMAITATAGFSACDTGTNPGETNKENSDMIEEGSIVADDPATTENPDAAQDSLEQKHYDGNEEGSAVHAGDGQGEGNYEKDKQ